MRILAVAVQRLLPVLVSVLIISGCSQSPEQACFPALDEKMPQYVIGYGSLMYDVARQRKLDSAATVKLPVIVDNYERGWITRSKPDGVKITRLGVTAAEGKWFNGIVLSVSAGMIRSMDRKESQCCRVEVSRENLRSMTDATLPEKGQFWIYQVQPKQLNKPAASYPILQSRVDEFLTGCIEQGERFKLENFSEQCLKSTEGWSVHWSNDRARPIGGKPVQAKFKEVDKLLEKLEGNLYENIRAE